MLPMPTMPAILVRDADDTGDAGDPKTLVRLVILREDVSGG
jgi:hypothetical protein